MTISKSYLELFKGMCPGAFSEETPEGVGTVFIDLQLKLMCPDGIFLWEKYFSCLIGNLVRKYINQSGIMNIVCAFDECVPLNR